MNVSRSARPTEPAIPINRIDMRTAPRYPILQRCFVYPAQSSALQAWKCIAYNVSTAGIAVTLPIELPLQTVLSIQAWNLAGARPLLVRIVHTKPVEHVWFTGCELLERMSSAELQVWRSGPVDWAGDAKAE